MNNSQDVRLDLPRLTGDKFRDAKLVRYPWLAKPVVPQPRQEWHVSEVQGRPRRELTVKLPVRKVIITVALIFGALFCIGLGTMAGQQQPDSTTQSTLNYAQSHAPAGVTCGAVWTSGASSWTIECGKIGG